MNLNTLAKATELQIVNNEHGWGREISYTYRRDNTTIPVVKALYQEGHLGKKSEEGAYDVDKDEATFFSVDLPKRPERGDKIVIDGMTWYVEMLLGSEPYDIHCVSNLNHTTGRSGRMER